MRSTSVYMSLHLRDIEHEESCHCFCLAPVTILNGVVYPTSLPDFGHSSDDEHLVNRRSAKAKPEVFVCVCIFAMFDKPIQEEPVVSVFGREGTNRFLLWNRILKVRRTGPRGRRRTPSHVDLLGTERCRYSFFLINISAPQGFLHIQVIPMNDYG
ncbi:hypothetical protein RB195_001605 [Necator americanus]|uniref:Uncharacterized protein n=1 Tax=Necator americanus TaxID=51031 RepID=A0ABR1DF44_NECAM